MTDTHATEEQPKRETLYITDAEMIRRMGVPENIAYKVIRALDENKLSGFPPKQKLWGDRRYWPAVKAYLDTTNGLRIGPRIDAARLIPENRPAPAAASPHHMRSAPRRSQ